MCLNFRLLVVMKMFQGLEGKLLRCKIVTSQYWLFYYEFHIDGTIVSISDINGYKDFFLCN